jgi:hypothetical protein
MAPLIIRRNSVIAYSPAAGKWLQAFLFHCPATPEKREGISEAGAFADVAVALFA